MKYLFQILGLVFLATAYLACENTAGEQENSKEAYTDVDVNGFKKLMEQHPDVMILDVRTPEEYAAGNIKGSTLINVNDPNFEAKVEKLPKDRKYLVYCRSGQRSVTACNIMAQKGFEDLTNLLGGYMAWEEE
jgi:rhodanese-related sulfurtransferase